jgi:hypothetical protein
MIKDVSSRLLRQQIPNANFQIADGDEHPGSLGWDEYTEFENVGRYYKVFLGYFDLSGYTIEQKTAFIQGVTFQNVGNNRLSFMDTGFPIDECRILTTTPMAIEDFIESSFSSWAVPGTPTSNFSTEQVVDGTMIEYQMDVGASIGRASEASNWGVGSSTAAEKLYFARAFRFPRVANVIGPGSYSAAFPAVNVIVPIVVGEEPDLEYIMRLKRSTELT